MCPSSGPSVSAISLYYSLSAQLDVLVTSDCLYRTRFTSRMSSLYFPPFCLSVPSHLHYSLSAQLDVLVTNDCLYRTRFTSRWATFVTLEELPFVFNGRLSLRMALEDNEDAPWLSVGSYEWSIKLCAPPAGTANDSAAAVAGEEWLAQQMVYRMPTPTCSHATTNASAIDHCVGTAGYRRLLFNPRRVDVLQPHAAVKPADEGVDISARKMNYNRYKPDAPMVDTSEQVYISSLALLKMLKHGRAGVPMEVMGLMLGEFVDDYTVRVVDVFAMPQSGTGVSVEAVDPVFQTKMLDMLKQTGRPEMVVGWYHSHPGFGCWLSGVDINTQQSFEALNQRAVAVVVDPIQSVKGKVVIDAFRLINPQTMMLGQEPRQTTSNLGHLHKPSIQALIHGLNRHYYSIGINYRKNELEEKMLLNLHKKKWAHGLTLQPFESHNKKNEQIVQDMLELAQKYNKAVQEEDTLSTEKFAIASVGRQDAKKHLEEHVSTLMSSNIVQTLGTMLDTVVF
ncbi:unnamed protein product [Closterium sp. Naga37s-1]|nr:unnamed protein product [Closterium sp. Naga37s-1]